MERVGARLTPGPPRLRRTTSALALLLCAGCFGAPEGPPERGAEPELTFGDVPGGKGFRVLRVDPVELSRKPGARGIVVWTGEVEPGPGCVHPEGLPTVLGRTVPDGTGLRFVPRFAFVPDLAYTACFELVPRVPASGSGDVLKLTFRVTSSVAEAELPRVVGIWPTSESVPSNLLRLYVHFSEPMTARDVGARVALLDELGEEIEDAFVDIPEGLWDARFERLTLFLHPGRIKRGVGPNRELGPPLRAGGSYRVRIDAGLRSRRGPTLGESFEQRFLATTPDRSAPDPTRWSVEAPRGDRDAVVLRFDEALDRAQLARFASVVDAAGEVVEGVASPSEDGWSWSFVPRRPWSAGRHRVLAGRWVEDLAGNSPARLFDVETFTGTDRGAAAVAAPTSDADVPIEIGFEADVASEEALGDGHES